MAEQPFKVRKLNINGSYILASDFDPSETGLYAPVPSLYFRTGTTLIYTKTGSLDTDWIPLENTAITDLINSIFSATGEPTGFPIGEDGEVDRSSSTISFNGSNRTFTIAPTTTSYYFFVKGVKYTKTSSLSVTIDSEASTYYIYFDNDGDLQYFESSSFPKEILLNHALVSLIVWNGTSAVHIGDERHGCTMDAHTHIRLHTNQGSVYQSGFGMASFVIDGNGSLDTHAQFSIDSGSMRDEDILHISDAVSSTTAIPEFYRTGSGTWNRGIKTNFKFLVSTNSIIEYNEFTGGTWSRTEVSANKFVLRHVLATNDIDYPFFSIMGLAEYGNVSEARENALTELSSYAGLPFVEFVPIATYIIQSNDTYTNSVNARIVSTDSGSAYIDWRRRGIYLNPNVSEVNIHNSLSGLEGGGSGFFYHSNQPINTNNSVTFAGITDSGEINVEFDLVSSEGDLNNVSTSNTSSIRFNPANATSISGFDNGSDGKLLYIHNAGSVNITIKNDSSDSDTDNRILTGTGQNLILKTGGFITLQYDNTSSRWRISAGNVSVSHNDLQSIQGGDGTNYYHSDQPINISDDVDFNSLKLEKTLSFKGEIIYTNVGNLTSAQIDSEYSIIKLNPSSATTLHGIGSPTDGKIVIIQNISSVVDIAIRNQSTTELTANNRLVTGSTIDFTLKRNTSMVAIYSSEFRWRLITINVHNNLGNTQGGDAVNNNYFHSNQAINTSDSPSFTGLNLGVLNFGANPIVASGEITSGLFSTQNSSHWYYSQSTNSNIHGIGKTVSGSTILIISNIGTANLTLVNDSATQSIVDRRIITGTGSNIVLRPKTSILLIYDTVSTPNSWRVMGINRHNYFTDIQGGDGTNYYHSDQEINITSSPSFAGLTVATLTYPSTDGSANNVLKTDGDGTLSFGQVSHDDLTDVDGGDVATGFYHSDQAINTTDSPSFAGITVADLVYPSTDGSANNVLKTDGSGNLSFGQVSHDDLTDVDGGDIATGFYHSDQAINTTDSPSFAGITIADLVYPSTDGSVNEVLKTDGSGNLSFGQVSHDNLTDVDGGDIATGFYHSDQAINTTDSPSFAGITIADLVYPSTDGTSGQFLTTDGSGNLSFGSPVLDSYIIRYTVSLDVDTTTTLATVIGSNESGMYRFWLNSDPRVRGVLYVKSSDLSNSELEIASNKVTGITNTANCLNVYFNSNNIVFQNKIANDTLVILKIS